MTVHSDIISFRTVGHLDVHDLTDGIAEAVSRSGLKMGLVTAFCPSSTSAITTIEFEPGAVRDLKRTLETLVPSCIAYAHDERWGDGNGHSHIRASLLGPSLCIPFVGSKLILGTWQQVIHIDFDVRPRDRKVMLQLLGE